MRCPLSEFWPGAAVRKSRSPGSCGSGCREMRVTGAALLPAKDPERSFAPAVGRSGSPEGILMPCSRSVGARAKRAVGGRGTRSCAGPTLGRAASPVSRGSVAGWWRLGTGHPTLCRGSDVRPGPVPGAEPVARHLAAAIVRTGPDGRGAVSISSASGRFPLWSEDTGRKAGSGRARVDLTRGARDPSPLVPQDGDRAARSPARVFRKGFSWAL